jgi:hypothetical protein
MTFNPKFEKFGPKNFVFGNDREGKSLELRSSKRLTFFPKKE